MGGQQWPDVANVSQVYFAVDSLPGYTEFVRSACLLGSCPPTSYLIQARLQGQGWHRVTFHRCRATTLVLSAGRLAQSAALIQTGRASNGHTFARSCRLFPARAELPSATCSTWSQTLFVQTSLARVRCGFYSRFVFP